MASALLAASALAVPASSASTAVEGRATASQLAAADQAVRGADVPGTAWYTDQATGKVVLTADSTVSAAEIAKIRKAAG